MPSTSPGPNLTVFRPTAAANGVTLLIVPGRRVRTRGHRQGRIRDRGWFAVTPASKCAVLRHRLPADGWAAGADVPIHDIQRAVRLLRSATATPFERDARGRHRVLRRRARRLRASSRNPRSARPRVDAIDDTAANVDFAVLMYPVIATTGSSAHAGSARKLLAGGVAPRGACGLFASPARRPAYAAHPAGARRR